MGARIFKIVVCRGPECGDRRGSALLHPVFAEALARNRCEGATLEWQSCFGRCSQGPNVLVREIVDKPGQPRLGTGFATVPGARGATALYNDVDVAKVERIVTEHVAGGRIVREYIQPVAVVEPTTGENPP